jgi:hypothetical protein
MRRRDYPESKFPLAFIADPDGYYIELIGKRG